MKAAEHIPVKRIEALMPLMSLGADRHFLGAAAKLGVCDEFDQDAEKEKRRTNGAHL